MAVRYKGGGTYASTTSSLDTYWITGTSTTDTSISTYNGTGSDDCLVWYANLGNKVYGPRPKIVIKEVVQTRGIIEEPTGHLEIYLKDGTHIVIDREQNLRVRDENSKIVYKSNRVREFNRYVNASDLLEAFIRDLGDRGVRQNQVLDTRIEVFINWLIYKAALQDGDKVEEPKLMHQPQCKYCGKFISKMLAESGFEFCNPDHAKQLYERLDH